MFFSILFNGRHHLDSKIKEWGSGWCINTSRSMCTFDSSMLTKLVLMAHKYAVRVEVNPSGPGMLKVCITQRKRDGSMFERHPDIETAIKDTELPDSLEF